jgi:hypothetical protein
MKIEITYCVSILQVCLWIPLLGVNEIRQFDWVPDKEYRLVNG